ncbi:hypothetical protein HD554DRAFT_2172006 [Boletus coccyginus]|nr:hypothetical protein HD554DRAFT_2172006 [Boletus coccyginus]
MHAAKFTVFYVIAALAALASASPVPVAVPEARAVAVANADVVAVSASQSPARLRTSSCGVAEDSVPPPASDPLSVLMITIFHFSLDGPDFLRGTPLAIQRRLWRIPLLS